MTLIDPAIMQLIQVLVYAVGGLLAALATYYAAKAKVLSENNGRKLDTVEVKAVEAKVAAETAVKVAAVTATQTKDAIADNTEKTDAIRKIVNGQRDAHEAEIQRLREMVTQLGGKP